MDLYAWFTLVVILCLVIGVVMSLLAYEWGKQQGMLNARRQEQHRQNLVIRAGRK